MNDAWCSARRILAVRLDAAGDVLMTAPALRALREAVPGRAITLLTSPAGAAAAALLPEVDDVIEYVAPWMKPPSDPDPAEQLAMIERLRAREFDAAVIFTVYSQNPLPAALVTYLAGIPLRLAHCRENPYGLLTDWIREPEPQQALRHEVRRQLDLVATVGGRPSSERLHVQVPGTSRDRVADLIREAIDIERPWVVLHVGASAESRRYPHFAPVARALHERLGWQLVFTGGIEEASLLDRVRDSAGVPSVSLAGVLDFAELAALVAAAPLVISNNSGPAHLAAAAGTPVVDLYALTNPQHAPWMVPHRLLFNEVPCAPCYRSVCPEGHHGCLAAVTPDDVVAAAVDLAASACEGHEQAAPRFALLLRAGRLTCEDGDASSNAVRDLLQSAGDRGFAVATVASDGLGAVLAATEKVGVPPEMSVAVEDSPAGVRAAHAAGVRRVIGVAPAGEEPVFLAAGADEVIDGLGRLLLLTPPR